MILFFCIAFVYTKSTKINVIGVKIYIFKEHVRNYRISKVPIKAKLLLNISYIM